MPRGKGDLFNIDNLQDAIKAIEEIYNIIHKTGVSAQQWMNDNEKIVKEYDKLKRLSTDLFKQDEMAINARNQKFKNEIDKYHEQIRLREQQIEQEVQFRTEVEKRLKVQQELVDKQKELQEVNEKSNQIAAEHMNKMIEQAQEEYKNLTNVQKLLVSQDKYIQQRTGAYGKTLENNLNDFRNSNGGHITTKDIERIASTTENQVLKDSSELVKGSKGLNVAAQGLQLAGTTLKKVADKFVELFTAGINNQSSAYENSFTNISVRNGTTRSQYYGAQSRVNNILGGMGLRENIATSQVQEMWNTLASEGIKVDLEDQKTTTQAIETILTNQIVPYLDMSSAYMQKLANDNPNLMKQVRGIGTSIQNVEGSNVVANEYLQDMMTNLSPMGELAQQELGLQYADTLGQLENLRNQGLSDSQIGELYSKIKGMVEDPYNTISSGDTIDRLTFSQMMANNEDMHDSSAWLNYLTQNLDYLSSGVGKGNRSNLTAGIYANSLGGSASLWDTFNSKDIDAIQSIIAGDRAGSGVNIAANIATSAFTNDQNQTNKTLQNITLENLMNELSVVNQWMGNWTNVIVGAIQGIGNIILGVAGAKLGSSLLGGKASGILGKAGSVIGTGLSNAGSTLSGVGITGSAATALGAAGVTAGIAGAAYGIGTGIGQLQEGETGLGVTNIAGGAAMGVGAGLLLASNPVGWIVGAAGGAALLGAKLYELATDSGDISEQLQEQTNEVMKNYQQAHNEEIDSLNETRDSLLKSNDLEEQKQILINAGIATQEELTSAQYDNKDALVALTDQYIASQQELNGAAEELVSQLENKDSQQQNSISTGMFDILDKSYKDMSDSDKQAAAEFGKKYYSWLQEQAASGNKDASWRLNKMNKKGINLLDSEFTKEDLDAIMHYGSNSTSNELVRSFMTDSENVHSITTNSAVQSALGLSSSFSKTDWTTAAEYITSAINSDDEETINNYLSQAKALGLTYELLSELSPELTQQLKDKGINSYRQGINNVPEDQLAMLHKGEAVLTASTANELRNLTDTYRETTTQSYNIDAIIQNQTSALITKMNEIIRVITTGVGTSTTENTASNKLYDAMRTMSSTKAF